MLKYRLDANKLQIFFLDDEGNEKTFHFDDVYRMAHEMNTHYTDYFQFIEILKENLRTNPRNYKAVCQNIFNKCTDPELELMRFLLSDLIKYVSYYKNIIFKQITLINDAPKILKATKNDLQLDSILYLTSLLDEQETISNQQEFMLWTPTQMLKNSENIYFQPDCVLPDLMRSILILSNALGYQRCKCRICQNTFCGKKQDDCCRSESCIKTREKYDDNKLLDVLSSISRQIGDSVRGWRSTMKSKGVPKDLIAEYDQFAVPIQKRIVDKVKEYRDVSASLQEILALEKEKNQAQKLVLAKFHAILDKAGIPHPQQRKRLHF